MAGALAGVQVLAAQPVTGERWLAALLAAPIGGALLLTQSRGAFLALGFAVFFVAVLRHRWLLILMVLGGVIFFVAPFTASYRDRLLEGLGGEDLATQMRFGEYKDAFILIGRYPVIGVDRRRT
jgi:O-antigen ligase